MPKLHLTGNGYARVVQGVLSPQVLNHAAFARPEADVETVRMGWIETRDRLQQPRLVQQAALQQTVPDTNKEDDGATGGGVR